MELPLPEITSADFPGLIPSGRCPRTGRILWTRPEWNVDLPHYQNELRLLAPRIVYARSRGFIYGEDTLAYIKRFDALFSELGRDGKQVCIIEDWREVRGADTLARRAYVAYHVEHKERYAGFSFYGLNALTRLMISLGRKILTVPFPLLVSKNYDGALAKALSVLVDSGEPLVHEDGLPPLPGVLPLPGALLRGHARRLQEIFGRIPWDRMGEPDNPLSSRDPFHDLVAGWIAVKIDLDDLHRRNQGLEKNFRAIMESAQEGVWIAGVNGRTVWANSTMAALLGVRMDRMDDLCLMDALPNSLVREAHNSTIPACEVRLLRPDGKAVWVLVSAGPVPPDVDGTGGIYAICTDITQRREAEAHVRHLNEGLERRVEERTAELAASNLKLAEALRSREEFLAAMSHELRTPLATMLNVSESLRSGVHGNLESRQNERLALLEKNGRHLQSLIDDVLDLSKSIAGSFSLCLEVVDAAELARQCLSSIREMAQSRGISVVAEIPSQPVVAELDPLRIRQILLNLLSNASKFSPPGSSMGLRLDPQRADGRLVFEVWDHGPGISTSAQSKLFQPFVQLDTRLSREHGGAGLGLALSRRLAEAHRGTIELDSEVGLGARFRVVLPWKDQDDPLLVSVRKSGGVRRTETIGSSVLLVEDNNDLRQTVEEYLLASGWRVCSACGGAEALERFGEDAFDIVLMDIQMPGMDGLEAIRRLREIPAGRAVKIVAMSGLAFPEDKKRALLAGADLHLSKPVKLHNLVNLLSDQVKGSGTV